MNEHETKEQRRHGKPLGRRLKDNWQLYALLLIPVVLTIVYKYVPMYGIQIAFRDFNPNLGYLKSKWVGLDWEVMSDSLGEQVNLRLQGGKDSLPHRQL